MTPVEEAAEQGYTQDEINSYLSSKSQEAKEAGYSDAEIQAHIKGEVLQQPDFNRAPMASTGHANLSVAKSPTTLMEAIETGWNWSNIALGREALKGPDGKLPSMQVDESTPLALRAAANLTGTVADVPSMIAGGLIGGGPASPVTALGGAFALPMGLRQVFIDAIQSGEAGTRKEFADRALGTLWETAKGWITGAATGAVGKAASVAVSGLPGAARTILPTAAEIATLTEVGARLEGHAPTPESLIDNAIVLGVAKTVLPSWAATRQPNILHETYVKTGLPPEQVVQDAMRGDKNVWQDTLDGRVPDAYKGQVEHPPSAPTQTQRTEQFKTLYHGTPHTFEKFDLTQLGTGEGAQAFGHGMYFAENKKIAESYAKNLSTPDKPGNLYSTNVPKSVTENVLDWDKPIAQQSESVRNAIVAIKNNANEQLNFIREMSQESVEAYGGTADPSSLKALANLPDTATGNELHAAMKKAFTQGQYETADLLHESGIMGVKYLDATSRAKGSGTSNYVIFDPTDLNAKNEAVTKSAPSGKSKLTRPDPIRVDTVEWGLKMMRDAPVPAGDVVISKTGPDGIKTASINGQVIAKAELRQSSDALVVSKIETLPGAQKQGIGTQLLRDAQAEFPGKKLDWTATTEAGSKLKKKMEKSQEEIKPPTMTPEQQAQARAFMEGPFAEIPQAPNEPSRPTHINYNRIQTTDDAKMALSQLSTIYESKIKEQQQSPRSWEKSHQDAAKVLSDLLQSDPKTVTSFLKGEKSGPSTTAQLLARKELTIGFTEDLMRSRVALMAKGDKATPEELATFLSHVERVSNVQASFLGQRADVGRALNALKSTKRDAERSQAVLDAINSYGGEKNVSKLVELLGEYDNPAQAIKFAKEATKATKWEMVVEAWKAGLVSGLRTNEVNFLSTSAFTTLRLPTEAIAATIGAIKGKEDRVLFSEIPARMLGMTAGLRDGFNAAGAVLRTGDNITGPKTDTFEPKIPGKVGEAIRLPFRFLSASDVLLKTINERGELYALATKQAMNERAMGTQPTKQQSVTFKTSKGSTYKVESDGTTTRDKAARPEHPGDSGPQPKSETTFYVDEASMNKLSEFQAKGFGKRSIEKLPDGRVGIKYMDGKDAGKFESRTIITPESTPSAGLYPVELWEAGTKAHFGNKIIEVVEPSVQSGRLEGKPLFGRIADIVANPTAEMAAAAKDAALRYTFNKPLGPAGQSFQKMVRETHTEWLFPFITTPGNIFKETARMTPGLNFAVKEWRADYEAGGAKRDKALAEVAVGTAIMSAVVAAAMNGTITGNGTPDKGMRATEKAAGWKPYAVKVNGQYIDGYLRMAPIGPLIGLAADGAEFQKYMTEGERDQWARMLAFAFASNVTNQTFMSGATNFVNVLQDPSRHGQNYLEALSSSLVPSIIGQTAAEMDPLMREIHGVRDAMIARIPGQREGLMPSRDWTGEPIKSPERLWWGSPFSVSSATSDKVRAEAARVGFATPSIPSSLDLIPGKDFGKLDKIKLTPEQRDVFASRSGKMAYEILKPIVEGQGWDAQPDIIKRQVFEKVMKKSRDLATKEMLSGQDPALTEQAVDKIMKSVQK